MDRRDHRAETEKFFIEHLGEELNSKLAKPYLAKLNPKLAEHDELFWKMECTKLMHEMTHAYYWQRGFIINMLILCLGVAISVIGILTGTSFETEEGANSDTTSFESNSKNSTNSASVELGVNGEGRQRLLEMVRNDRQTTKWLIISTGVLGVVITFFKSFEKYVNWNSRADMHESAVVTLQDICGSLFTDRNRLFHTLQSYEDDEDMKAEEKKNKTKVKTRESKQKLNTYKAKFETMQKSCTDPIPAPIKNSFVELKEVFKYASYEVKFFSYRKYYYKLAKRHEKSVLKFNPPFFLACFGTNKMYKQLHKEIKLLVPKIHKPDNNNDDEADTTVGNDDVETGTPSDEGNGKTSDESADSQNDTAD